MKVGIPKTLAYYVYYPLWKRFLEELGAEVVVSSDTSREIVDAGVEKTVNDACVPIKIFHGHVLDLKDRVDQLFIPRLMSLNGETIYCPKFLGLPDMIKSSLTDLPPIIDSKLDFRRGKFEIIKVLYKLGTRFTYNPYKILAAFYKAVSGWKKFNRYLEAGYTAVEAVEILEGKEVNLNNSGDLKIAVLGYPYIIYDPFISINLIPKLRDLGVKVYTMEMVRSKIYDKEFKRVNKDLFWTFSQQVLKSGLYYYNQSEIDGLIHVTAFGCGPDFIVDKKLELAAKDYNKPFITLTIDEHTGEAGIVTRLEAFTDMLKRRGD